MARPMIACESYRFPLPEGWREYISGDEIGLAAEDFPAWMWIYPHKLRTMAEVESELGHGAKFDDIDLTLEDVPKLIDKTAVAVNFHGLLNHKKARGRLIGTIAPKYGGVFIFAATNSNDFFKALSNAADAIALKIRYKNC